MSEIGNGKTDKVTMRLLKLEAAVIATASAVVETKYLLTLMQINIQDVKGNEVVASSLKKLDTHVDQMLEALGESVNEPLD